MRVRKSFCDPDPFKLPMPLHHHELDPWLLISCGSR